MGLAAAVKEIVISFDFEHDRRYRYLLAALNANSSSALSFVDLTPGEINTRDVGRVKAELTSKIVTATHELVIIGAHANAYHPDASKIGTRNWQWFEIETARTANKSLIAVKIESKYEAPEPLYNANAKWALSFTVDGIIGAINEA